MSILNRHGVALVLAAGLAFLSVGARADSVIVGQSLALSGGSKGDLLRASRLQQGAAAYLNRINRRGGVHGARVILSSLDDNGKSDLRKSNLTALAGNPAVIALMGMAGGGNCRSAMAIALEHTIPMLGCMAGSPQLRQSGDGLIFNLRPGHDVEYRAMAEHFRSIGVQRAFFLHDDNETGRLHLANATKVMNEMGIALSGSSAVTKTSRGEDVAAAVRSSNAQGVFNQGPNSFFGELIVELRKGTSATHQFMSVCSGADTIVSQLGPASRGVAFTQVVPFPFSTDARVPLIQEYQKDMRESFPDSAFSYDSFEAYINARVLVLALQNLGPKPTRERLAKALRELGRIDLRGFPLVFDGSAAPASHYVDIVMASPGRGSGRPFIR